MQKIALILDSWSAKDFKINDIDIIGVASEGEAGERLAEIFSKKEFGLIIINRDLIGGLPMDIVRTIKESKDPIIIPIDINKDEMMDLKEKEELSRMLYRAIGAQLKGGDKIKAGIM
ncbi:MAG TPA: V-type ATP synthase subunit F [Nitrospiria bacterium]|nr:V-type ATP synthase subunit F [Nitrospiria bacterium]